MKLFKGKKRRKDRKKTPLELLRPHEALAGASCRLFANQLQESFTEADEMALAAELEDADPQLLRIIHEQIVICQEMADVTFKEALGLRGQIYSLRDLHREAKRLGREHAEKIVPFRGGEE